MFKEGTRVVIVNEKAARQMYAKVSNGQKGTVGKPWGFSGSVYVHMDSDKGSRPWLIP